MKKLLSLALVSLLITSCSGEETPIVEPVQKSDKTLSCEEILFEVNDSEQYIKQAKEKKSLGIKSIVMPLGYIDTYMTADEAISAANQRISYLKRIYDIRGCAIQQEQLDFQRKMQSNLQKQVQQQPASQNLYNNQYNPAQGGY
ncbi:MAG TPA: hypothetical protein DIV86_04485 [Alphaproteobacteria bacterium]|mgnify:CR=1 FL=1|nr:hypothetical protein [Alphaproteobacteria bacterium]